MDTLSEGYRATAEWHGYLFYRKLMGTYPYAKVILSKHDIMRNAPWWMRFGFKRSVIPSVVQLQPIYNHCDETVSRERERVTKTLRKSACHKHSKVSPVIQRIRLIWRATTS